MRDRDADAKECMRDDRVRAAIADWLTEWHMLAVYRPMLVKVGYPMWVVGYLCTTTEISVFLLRSCYFVLDMLRATAAYVRLPLLCACAAA